MERHLGSVKYDVILNQVGITEARQKAFDFSQPYTFSSTQLIARKNEKCSFPTLESLKGYKRGMGPGTNFEQKAKTTPGIDVKTYPDSPEYLADLARVRIDAVLNDRLLVGYLLKSFNLPLKAGATFGDVNKIGIPFQKKQPKFLICVE